MKVYLAFGLMLLWVSPCLSQTSLRDYAALGCQPIDPGRKSIYISYEGVERNPSGHWREVRLRLHNNLSCGIRVPTAGQTEVTLPDGEKTVELLPENSRAPVIYSTRDDKGKKVAKAAPEYNGVHVVGWPILPPGKSVTFAIPANYFKRKLDVVVTFVYAWEGFSSRSLVHQVTFLNEMLPEEMVK